MSREGLFFKEIVTKETSMTFCGVLFSSPAA